MFEGGQRTKGGSCPLSRRASSSGASCGWAGDGREEIEMTSDVSVEGLAHDPFGRVCDVFAENFAEREEVGAAVAVYGQT